VADTFHQGNARVQLAYHLLVEQGEIIRDDLVYVLYHA
jgi:hypothetical protein